MRVDAAALGLIVSGIGALVVVSARFAAVRQIRHLQHRNEKTAIVKFVDEWNSADFTADRQLVRNDLPTMLCEHPTMEGAISEDSRCNSSHLGERSVVRDARVRRPGTPCLRYGTVMEFFEDFAMRAPEWTDRNARRSKTLRRDPRLAADEGVRVPET